jgi:hypothetical protein
MPAHNRTHYDQPYKVRAKALRQRANADPLTRCWRCGRTLAEEQARQPGKPVSWHAGHTVDGDNTAPLLPEHSTCNTSAGATAGNLSRLTKGNRWW